MGTCEGEDSAPLPRHSRCPDRKSSRRESPRRASEACDAGQDEGRRDYRGPRARWVQRSLTDRERSFLVCPTRNEIFEQLSRTPGLNKNQLRERLEIERTTLDFHIRRLKRANLVVTKSGVKGRELVCFLRWDEHLWHNPKTRVLFGREPTRQVALYLAEHPGASTREVADAVKRTPAAVRTHIQTLRDHGLVESLRFRRRFKHRPREPLEEWAEEVGVCYRRVWEEDI